MTTEKPLELTPAWLTPYELAESHGYFLVSSDYLQKLELLAQAATQAFHDPDLSPAVEDALKTLGRI